MRIISASILFYATSMLSVLFAGLGIWILTVGTFTLNIAFVYMFIKTTKVIRKGIPEDTVHNFVKEVNWVVYSIGTGLLATVIVASILLPKSMALMSDKRLLFSGIFVGMSYVIGALLIICRWYNIPSKLLKF